MTPNELFEKWVNSIPCTDDENIKQQFLSDLCEVMKGIVPPDEHGYAEYNDGFNACRSQILSAIEKMGEKK